MIVLQELCDIVDRRVAPIVLLAGTHGHVRGLQRAGMLYLSRGALQDNAVALNSDEDFVCLRTLRYTSYAVASTGTKAVSVSAHAATKRQVKAANALLKRLVALHRKRLPQSAAYGSDGDCSQ